MVDVNRIRKCSIIQQDSSDCGVACLVSIINYFGGYFSIENLRKLSGTDRSGTSMLGLYQSASVCGFDVKGYEGEILEIIAYPGTLILHVQIEVNREHYIVCFGFEDGKFIIWDPAKGLEYIDINSLEKVWKSKKCLGLIPNSSFKKMKNTDIHKKQWLLDILKPDYNLLIISIITGILVSGLGLVMAVFSQKLIDNILPSKDLKILIISIILVLILLGSRLLLGTIRQLILLSQGRSFNIRVVDDFFGKILFLPKPFFDTRKTGDFVGRLNDTLRIQRVITEFVSVYLIDILVVVISLVILFIYSPVTFFITNILLSGLFFIAYRWNTKIINSQREVMSKYANNESNYIDSIQGISEIKSMNWQKKFKDKNKVIFSDFQDKAFHLGRIKIKLGLITGIGGTIYITSILTYTSICVIKSVLSQGELMAIISICSNILPSCLNLALLPIATSELKVAISRMFEFVQLPTEKSADLKNFNSINLKKIELSNISFRFPGSNILLNNINICLEKGRVVSLIGESGCGKSTLVNIIIGFYEPEGGKIIFNGNIDSQVLINENRRSSIGIIPQEIHIFNGTILQNLLPEYSDQKMKELESMIVEYRLESFFDSFPCGLETIVGEEGINLSGGQKQILAFIRALYSRPDFLLIDEGTSNMDHKTEKLILDLVLKTKNQMGIFMISHKKNLIKKISDKIYLLENGSITDVY